MTESGQRATEQREVDHRAVALRYEMSATMTSHVSDRFTDDTHTSISTIRTLNRSTFNDQIATRRSNRREHDVETAEIPFTLNYVRPASEARPIGDPVPRTRLPIPFPCPSPLKALIASPPFPSLLPSLRHKTN